MLKIVDYYPNTKIPFPLKELEKFGFEYNNDLQMFYINKKGSTWKIRIFTDDRKIEIITTTFCNLGIFLRGLDDLLFDLIKADLVEKVEE